MKRIYIISTVLCLALLSIGYLVLNKGEPGTDAGGGLDESVSSVPTGLTPENEARSPSTVSSGVECANEEAASTVTEDELRSSLNDLNISPAVREIIGLDGEEGDYNARRSAMQKLTRNMSRDDVDALMVFLDFKYADNDELQIRQFNAIKNDVVNVLLRQNDLPHGLGSSLVNMFRDHEHDDVWRDYCIQYMAGYYTARRGDWVRKRKDNQEGPEDTERKAIRSAYWEAVGERGKTVAGTALIGLESLSGEYDEFDRTQVAEAAVGIALDDDCFIPNRITALRLSSKMGKKDVLPKARVIAQTGASPVLRLAAIATLGDLGDKSDVELIESMVASSEKRIANMAQATLKRLHSRATQ